MLTSTDAYVIYVVSIQQVCLWFSPAVCECNGRASSCVFDQELFEKSGNVSGGMCVGCTGNTVGPRCDECAKFFYHDPSLPNDSTDFCQREYIMHTHVHHGSQEV